MKPFRLWKLLLVSTLAFIVVGCKPYASFVVTPDPLIAGQTASFDASGSIAAPSPRSNELVSYAWDFGDGQTGSGQVATHVYAVAGSYDVTLTIKDKASRVSSVTETVLVQPASGGSSSADLSVVIRGADGALLPGAEVSVGDQSGITDIRGVANIADVPAGASQLLRVKKTGFIGQIIALDLVADTKPREIGVSLLPVKETLRIEQAEEPQVLMSKVLGASVTLPAEALVTSSGSVATGPVSLQLTPWNVQGEDVLATLGQARTSTSAQLGSVGALTVDFFDATGNKLQLGAGKSADIQMNLTSTTLNGAVLSAGSTMPLHHFDEATGTWTVEGTGEVVESSSSPTGLALKGTVGHFSTWSWGGHGGGTGNLVTVRCVDTLGATVRCSMSATSVRSDGSFGTWNAWYSIGDDLPSFRLPADLAVVWHGQTADGLTGSLVTAVNADITEVTIVLGTPATSNVVTCLLPDTTPVACDVTLTSTLADGSPFSKSYFVPVQGATIQAGLPATATLSWQAKAFRAIDLTTLLNTGTATSGANGAVNISLGSDQVVSSRTARVRCSPYTNTSSGDSAVLDYCKLQIVVHNPVEGITYSYLVQVEPSVYVNVPVPVGGTADIEANGTITPQPDLYSFPYEELHLNYDALGTQTSYTMRLTVTII